MLRVTTAGPARAAGVFDRLPEGLTAGDWYMDYRNADGSTAQMCGNGVRVFAHYLRASGLEARDEFVVGSLAGPRPVVLHGWDATTADVTVEMGKTNQLGTGEAIVGGRPFAGWRSTSATRWRASTADLPPPAGRPRRRRARAVRCRPVPEGVNVEVLTAPHGGAVSMRVHERGVGETRSCSTGTVAAAVAALAFTGAQTGLCGCASPAARSPSRSPTPAATCAGRRYWWPRRTIRGMVACAAALIRMHDPAAACKPVIAYDLSQIPINDTPSAGELALEDRSALRRVAGLSTELADISEVEYRSCLERVVLVGVWTEGGAADAQASMAELAALAETAGSEVLEGLIQRRDKPDPSTYIGPARRRSCARLSWPPAPTPSSATAN